MKTFKSLCIAVTLMATSVNASDQVPQVSQKPTAMMSKLSVLEGNWTAITSMTQDDGKTWQSDQGKLVNVKLHHKNMVLEEKVVVPDVRGFNMLTFITYDQYRQTYRKAAIDDVWGIMDMYEGNITDDKLIFTNLKSATFFPVGPEVWRGFKLTLELKSGEHWMWIDKTDDNGKTWQPAFKVLYKPA